MCLGKSIVFSAIAVVAAFQHRPSILPLSKELVSPWPPAEANLLEGKADAQQEVAIAVKNAAHLKGQTFADLAKTLRAAASAAAQQRNISGVEHVVVALYSSWCPYCQQFLPFYDTEVAPVTQSLTGDASTLLTVANCAEVQQLTAALRIEGVPSIAEGKLADWLQLLDGKSTDSSVLSLTHWAGATDFYKWMYKRIGL